MKSTEKTLSKILLFFLIVGIIIFLASNCTIEKSPVLKFCSKIERKIHPDTLSKFAGREEADRSHLEYYEIFSTEILQELNRNEEIMNIFDSNDVTIEIDKISILFFALHRKVNQKEIQFDSLIKETKLRRMRNKEYDECIDRRKKIAEDNFEKIEEGDIIELSYPYYELENDYKNACLYDCPSEYQDKNDKYVFLTGKVISKFGREYYGSTQTLNFELKIQSNSDENIPILMQRKRVNDTHYVELESYGREIKQIKK